MKALLLSILAPLAVAACAAEGDVVSESGSAVQEGGYGVAVSCTDTIDAIYGDPGPLGDEKGAILRCAQDRVWTRSALEAHARSLAAPYVGKPFTSGARALRVTYRTERGNTPASPGYSSALVLLPDTPSTPRGPAVVAAHGTAGQSPNCLSILSKDTFASTDDAYASMILPIVGAGYAVIVPDYAGFANFNAPGNPPAAYAASADEGKSILDGVRALRKLAPRAVSEKAILIGHSQGGHSVLSALAMSESYGVAVSGVVGYSPLWFNEAAWGALLFAPETPVATNLFPVGVGIWYHYSHGELLDGQGHGGDIFREDKRAAIKNFFDNECSVLAVKGLGRTVSDLYTPEFAASIKAAAALGTACAPNDELCATWKARYAADRPHLTGKAAKTPVMIMYGSADTTIPPDRATCGFSRLRADRAAVDVCVTDGDSHKGVVGATAGYVNDWIAHVAQGAPAPARCAHDETFLKTASGEPVTCAPLPPND